MAYTYLDKLTEDIRKFKNHGANHSLVYKLLKEELSRLGYWKNRRRGDPAKGKLHSVRKKAREEKE